MPPITKAKKHYGREKQSGNNLFAEGTTASSARPARITARIEFGGPQFLIRSGDDGNEKRPAHNTRRAYRHGAVRGVVGIEGGVVSGF
jgi:hypothetical protein